MSTIQSLLESANPWKSLQSDAARLATKWAKTGLLEGLDGEINRNNMAMMLENQAKQLVVESSNTGTGASFTTGTGEQWAGIALPLVRKVFGQIASKEFVSVQPMNLPSGLVFFLDFQYGTTKSPFTAGNSMYGGGTNGQYPFSTNATNGGLYGAGRFSYSTNVFSQSATFALATSATALTITSASWSDVNYDSSLSASAARNEIKKFAFTTASFTGFAGVADLEAIRSFTLVSGSVTAATNLNAFFSYDGNATLNFYVTASQANIAASSANVVLTYSKKTADNARGDFEDPGTQSLPTYSTPSATTATGIGGTATIGIPEINVQMQSQAIVAKTKKLKAVWTPEFAQDLNAYQNIDAEAELTSMMSEYVSLEIDLEILDMLILDAAAGTEYWSAINNTTLNSNGSDFTQSLGFYNSQGQWFQTLGTKIQKLSNKIHQLTLRGGANFMVVSPTVSTILESIPGFAADVNGNTEKMNYAFGVQKVGQMNGRYKVYKNPYMNENTILLGFRGSQFLETGAVFAPYIPLIMTPLVYDPNTFTPRKGLLTRYAKKMLRPEFYAKIYVSGLNTI